MTATVTLIDDTYSANLPDGTKRIVVSVSLTNPYSTGGEAIALTSFFKKEFRGASKPTINASVTTTNAGIASTGAFRGDTTSLTPVLQLFNVSLGGATAGMLVDNTVANLSNTTFNLELVGI